MTVPLWLRRLVRPLIPDRVMAVVRLAEHSRQVRTNVDVVVDGPAAQRRWLATTPDTYRVRGTDTFPDARPDGAHVCSERALDAPERHDLLRPLADPAVGASVLAEAAPPGLVARRRTEPRIVPIAVAVRPGVWSALDGGPPVDPHVVLDRLRQAGTRLALVPVEPTGRQARRTDPIEGPGSAVVLALVPLHDAGGGSRGAQLALELLRRDWHVTYVAAYGTAESVDLGLRVVHPRLETRRLTDIAPGELGSRLATPNRLCVVEAPLPEHRDLARSLQALDHRVVYDLIDDWSAPSLGGRWYRPEVEADLAELADALTATAPALAERLRTLTGRDVALVPNAVNEGLFGRGPGPRPHDLPATDGPLLGYHGSLYGGWFDWTAVRDTAEAWRDGLVVLIGDAPDEHPRLPGNVRFLGLKPQATLPDYLHRFDVGLIPFVVTEVTHAVSPLKVYEYLASGVPVAAPPLRTLAGLDGVHTHPRLVEAVRAALAAPRPDPGSVLGEHTWAARVDQLLELVGFDVRLPGSTVPVRFLTQPVTHHPRRRRRVAAGRDVTAAGGERATRSDG